MSQRRLKDNFSIIREEDRSRLLDAKDEVEKEQAEQKWELIAVKVRESGGDQYTVGAHLRILFHVELTDRT